MKELIIKVIAKVLLIAAIVILCCAACMVEELGFGVMPMFITGTAMSLPDIIIWNIGGKDCE